MVLTSGQVKSCIGIQAPLADRGSKAPQRGGSNFSAVHGVHGHTCKPDVGPRFAA